MYAIRSYYGRVLVRRSVPVELKQGESVVPVALGQVDPATVFSLDSLVTILGSYNFV